MAGWNKQYLVPYSGVFWDFTDVLASFRPRQRSRENVLGNINVLRSIKRCLNQVLVSSSPSSGHWMLVTNEI